MNKKNKIQNRKGKKINKVKKAEKKSWFYDKPILLVSLKSLLIVIIFFTAIQYIDTKGYFNPDERNNHTKKKWDSFYDFTDKKNVDILLLGNSHLYSGINPKNLSLALGCNAFILASPGTNIADTYFGLKEALKRTYPKIVVIETYGINNFNPYKLKEGSLSDQFKSFYARKDFITKLASLPYLFNSDNYFYAWSNTLRNHDFIFNDTTQLSLNKKLIKEKKKKNKKLYLGRFVRFQTGIEQEVINKYDSLGAPVKGIEYTYSKYAKKYVDEIVKLCEKKGIELIFLTLPMYEKHISNYDKWESKLSEIINKSTNKWIDMQKEPYYSGFDTFAFENTYSSNQHMTYIGSLMASYKLVDYIRDSLKVKLPERNKDKKWHKIFYGEEGYFENYTPSKNDNNNKVICSDKVLRNVKLNSLLLLNINNKKGNKLIAKANKQILSDLGSQEVKLRILLKFEINGTEQVASVDLIYDKFHRTKDEVIFTTMIKPLKIIDVLDGAILNF